jgi:hypothetical protein
VKHGKAGGEICRLFHFKTGADLMLSCTCFAFKQSSIKSAAKQIQMG